MKQILIATLCVALVLLSHTALAQTTSVCATDDEDVCYARVRSNDGNQQCVWKKGNCQVDPCAAHITNATCKADADCVSTSWLYGNGATTCMSYTILCNKLSPGAACDASGLCRTDKTRCSWALPSGAGTPGENKDPECLKFPLWSIALVVVWIIIMVILVFIIMILKKKKHTEAIKGVEQENEVVVDSLHINDNFQPNATTSYSQPLTTNQL